MKNQRVVKTEKILANGMKVILLYKKDYVQSLFMIGIPAGGRNVLDIDSNTKEVSTHPSGCAHYLEHQNFRLNGQDVTPQLAAMQAQTNAFTSYSETCYYVSTSADVYGPLGLLIDFVQTLDITQNSVDKEKGIILSELHMDQNQPESRIFHETFRSLYRNVYLKNDILGTDEDISNMTVKDLQNFYSQFYDPSRLVLIGVTGQDPTAIMEFIEKKEQAFPSSAGLKKSLKPYFDEEPDIPARSEFSLNMDVYEPYQAIGVKLHKASSIKEALRRDYIVNFWLDSLMGPLNLDYQKWLDERILSQFSGAEADITEDYGYMVFYSQTSRPQAFVDLVNELLDKKPLVDQKTFEALRIMNRANSIRALEHFESLALDHIRGSFGGYDPMELPDEYASISLDEINNTIRSLDLSNRVNTSIRPFETELEEPYENEADDESSKEK